MAGAAAAASSHKIRIGPEETFLAAGMRGTGKTTLTKRIAASWRPNVIVWDVLNQYGDLGIGWRPPSVSPKQLNHLARWAWETRKKLVLEEAEQIVPQGPPPPQVFKDYVQLGRNVPIDDVNRLAFGANVRRPQAVSKFLLDEADHLFIFKLAGRALTYMADYIGGREGRQLLKMRTWVKDPRQGGGRFFHYHEGELVECPPLRGVAPDYTAAR